MIYGQDEPVLFPVADLYDSGMMGAYLSAVKEQYEQGRKDMENFVSKYGDFTSPIQSDVEFWNNNTMGPVVDMVNEMYANGIDPTRNPEARAMLLSRMRNVPYAKLNQMRQSAAAANEYLKNMADLAKQNLYNSDYENFLLSSQGLPNLQNWDSSRNGIWNRTSPYEYKDLNAATSKWFDNVNRNGYLYSDGNYDYFGVKEDDLQKVLEQNIPDFINTDYGKYQLELARRTLGPDASDAEALAALKKNIVSANRELTLNPSRVMNDERKLAIEDEYARKREDRAFNRSKQLEDIKFNHEKELENMKLNNAREVARIKASGGGGAGSDGYTYWTNQYSTGAALLAGVNPSNYKDNESYINAIAKNVKPNQSRQINGIIKKVGTPLKNGYYTYNPYSEEFVDSMIDKFSIGDVSSTFAVRTGQMFGSPDSDGYYNLDKSSRNKVMSKYAMATRTYGVRKTYRDGDDTIYKDAKKFKLAQEPNSLYMAYQKDGYIHQYKKIYIPFGSDDEEAWLDLGPVSEYTDPKSNGPVNIAINEKAKEQVVVTNAQINKGLGSQKTSNNSTE